jgi:hypothetical protein
MICYRDQSYCTHSLQNLCINRDCPQAVTEADREGAVKCGLDFCVADFRTEDCGQIENPTYTHLKEIVGGN